MSVDVTYRFNGTAASGSTGGSSLILQSFTVATSGLYDIMAYGAQGGSGTSNLGGYGAEVGGAFQLTAGETLEIVVGSSGASGSAAGGGGGGSFIFEVDGGTLIPLLVAGGGGGAGAGSGGAGDGDVSVAGSGAGGSGDLGGGGAGVDGNGSTPINATAAQSSPTFTGGSINHGYGGSGGGYGGGGASTAFPAFFPGLPAPTVTGGGGGGGYSGGGGASSLEPGIGGSSYAAVTPTIQLSGVQTSDGNGLVHIESVPCYCTATRLRTVRGDIAVEDLSVGDLVITSSGAHRPIAWLGHRTLDLTRHPDLQAVFPVRIRAGAFAESVPSRDLWMSPGHRVFVDGGLLAIRYLINGTTIVQEQRDTVTYWHVELDSHDVILAEGLAAESYLDTGNRTAFENGGADLDLHRDFETRDSSDACAPLIKLGPQVEAIKAGLGARIPAAGFVTTTLHDLHLVADSERIDPIDLGRGRFAFALPAGTTTIDLVSRTFIPRYGDPKSKDDRALGLLVKRLEIDGTDVDLAAIDATLGWHKLEGTQGHAQRWTSGRTSLPAGSRIVILDLVRGGRYWIERRDNVTILAA